MDTFLSNKYIELILRLLAQFAGGPGPKENNFVRFGLPMLFWATLLFVAWSRQRHEDLPRERMLIWGFSLGLARELFMFVHTIEFVLKRIEHDQVEQCLSQPFEHTLAMAAILVIIASFLRYLLDDARISRRYLYLGLAATGLSYLLNLWWWPQYMIAHPGERFHQTWGGLSMHYLTAFFILVAIVLMFRKRGWLRNVVSLALFFFLLGEVIISLNAFTDEAYKVLFCPVANTFHMMALPVLGFVYFREQSIEKRAADRQLADYRNHLEDLVSARTEELTAANVQLQREIVERKQAEAALAELSHRNELILNSAGEGIFGVNLQGRHTFVNLAAANMLGYQVEELIGRPSHKTWHHTKPDGRPYPESECPLHTGYKTGQVRRGTDQVFWRKDDTGFPVEYMSTPITEGGELKGAVVVFKDIAERKRAEAEIARRNAELAAQNRIAATVSQSLELDTILNTALNTVSGILDMNVGCIFLLDPETGELTARICRVGSTMDTFHGTTPSFSLEQKISERAVREMSAVVVSAAEYASLHPSSPAVGQALELLVSIPLVAKGRPLGALTLGAARADAVPAQSLQLLTAIGQQIGMAIENARLYQQAEVAAALEERQRIAAEMHDGLAQMMSYIGHKVDEVSDHVTVHEVSPAVTLCQEIRAVLDQATHDIRQSIASLRAAPGPRRSLQEELLDVVEGTSLPALPPVAWEDRLDAPLYVSSQQEEQILRVVQEALLNAGRHARAQQVTLSLSREAQDFVIRVQDDGQGFDPSAPPEDGDNHFGLSIMHARAGRIGGQVAIDAAPGEGTCVTLRWPASE